MLERLEDPVVRTVVDHFVRELQRSQSSVVYMLDRAPLCFAAPRWAPPCAPTVHSLGRTVGAVGGRRARGVRAQPGEPV